MIISVSEDVSNLFRHQIQFGAVGPSEFGLNALVFSSEIEVFESVSGESAMTDGPFVVNMEDSLKTLQFSGTGDDESSTVGDSAGRGEVPESLGMFVDFAC